MFVSSPVIFINPPGPANLYRSMVCAFVSKAKYIWQPHDFINLSAQIPAEYKLRLIDCSINNYEADYVFDEIGISHPGLCVAAISSILFNEDLIFLKKLKSRFPGLKLLVIGNILLEKYFRKQVLEYADGLILNSLDVDLCSYIKNGTTNSKNLILKDGSPGDSGGSNDKVSLKKVSIGIPRHSLFLNKRYRFPFAKSYLYSAVTTQFGCPFQCAYCSWAKIPVSYRDYTEVLEELKLATSLGIKNIFFTDPSFGFPKKNAFALAEGIIKIKLGIKWSCYANPLLLDKEFLSLMKKAGCHTLITGIDDGDFDMLRQEFNRDVPEAKIIEFCNICHDLGMQVCGDFIIGLNQANESCQRIINIAKKLDLDYASFNIFSILVGSLVREKLIKECKFSPCGASLDPSGNSGQIDKRLVHLRNLAVRKFYMRPRYLLKRMMKIKSFNEFVIQFEEMIGLFSKLRNVK
ncbi:MAG: radical SAM protein [Candidatus Omnitrophica bacterium]|nr:radical SAM protein [Candidatus Omnitrophota bacterium]MDD5690539.1 radical SAM protein [Candidatus Omnitrophota bacterium]